MYTLFFRLGLDGLGELERTRLTIGRPYTVHIFRHGLLIRTLPTDGTIALLLLQPRPKAGQPSTRSLLAAAKQHTGANVPSSHAAHAFDPDLLETEFSMLATTNAPADVQHWIPNEHDSHGLASSDVPEPEAHNHDPGACPKDDGRI